jgi:hypothetical protein
MKHFYFTIITLLVVNLGFGQIVIPPTNVYFDENNQTRATRTAISPDVPRLTAVGLKRSSSLEREGVVLESYQTKGWTSSSLFDAQTKNEYIEWSITANANFGFVIKELKIQAQTSNADALGKYQIFYSLNNSSTKTALKESVNTLTSNDISVIEDITDLAIATGLGGKITFRLYAWSDTNSADPDAVFTLQYFNSFLVSGASAIRYPIAIKGEIQYYSGLTYDGTYWGPQGAPSANTGTESVFLLDGTYNLSNQDINVNNITVDPTATIKIFQNSNLTVLGRFNNLGRTLVYGERDGGINRYGSLIVNGLADGRPINYFRPVNKFPANDLIAPPVSGQTFEDFLNYNSNAIRNVDEELYLFGPFNKTDGIYETWTYSQNATANLVAGTGYRAGSLNNDQFIFTGTINTSNVSVPVFNSGTAYKKWNLIGNPYPSYILVKDFLIANATVFENNTAAVYGFDGNSSDGWTTIAIDNATDVVMTPGQGFFVSSMNPTGTITFTPAMRTTGTTDDFISNKTTNETKASVQVNIKNGTKNYKTEVYFNQSSTTGLDKGYDAAVYGTNAPAFAVYTHLVKDNKDVDMAIQSLPYTALSDQITIPLGINATKGQQVTVSLGALDMPEGIEVYLEDNVTNSFTLLNTSDYNFTTTSDLVGTGRFFLNFTNTTLSSGEALSNGLQIYATASKTLMIKGLLKENTAVSVYDLQGREVSTLNFKANTNSNNFNLMHLSTGIYVVKLKNRTQEKTQKIILN